MEEGLAGGKAKRKEIKKIRMREDKKLGGFKAGSFGRSADLRAWRSAPLFFALCSMPYALCHLSASRTPQRATRLSPS